MLNVEFARDLRNRGNRICGAAGQQALGTAVFGGMLASTFLAVFFVRVFFVVFQTMGEWWRGNKVPIIETDSVPT